MLDKIGSTISNAASSALDNVSGQLGEIKSNLTNIFGKEGSSELPASDNNVDMIFPIEMAKGNRPVVCFTCFVNEGEKKQVHTYFPIPSGLNFSDSAEFNSINLGMFGGAFGQEIQDAVNAEGTVFERSKDIASRIGNRITSVNKEEAALIAATLLPYKDQVSLQSRTIRNPNTNVTFGGHGVRGFQFKFKMIAKSKDEAKLIRKIQERFRYYTYANAFNGTGFLLSYPPTWLIRFYAPDKNNEFKEMIHIPRIFSCYLTGVTTSINDGSVTFYNDGAPTEVDVSLEFRETRSLTRKDIIDMENDKLENRGLDPDGRPTIQNPEIGEPITPQIAEK